jgi:hypothetical protein
MEKYKTNRKNKLQPFINVINNVLEGTHAVCSAVEF